MTHKPKHLQTKRQKGSQGMKHKPSGGSTYILNSKKKPKDSQGMKHEPSARITHPLNSKKSRKAVVRA